MMNANYIIAGDTVAAAAAVKADNSEFKTAGTL